MKDFIPYEPALALKELGFDEPCFGYYGVENEFVLDTMRNTSPNYSRRGFISAPLYQQALRWFREKYNYNHSIVFTKHPFGTDEYQYMILLEDDECVEINFKTYEEAELACLNRLIEIVKTKQL